MTITGQTIVTLKAINNSSTSEFIVISLMSFKEGPFLNADSKYQ